MVRTHNSIAGIEKGTDDGTYIGHTLTIIIEPRAAVDMNNYRIAVLLLLGQIDVAGMEGLAVTDIVDILPLLGGLNLGLFLYTSEASGWLCHRGQKSKKGKYTQVKKALHNAIVFSF